ncbi:hypothetical protein Hanom_Chr03g00230491 [Helianthus anomalus]
MCSDSSSTTIQEARGLDDEIYDCNHHLGNQERLQNIQIYQRSVLI